MGKSRRKQKVIPPPQLPPDVPEEYIEFSDEDLKYVEENTEYARFVSRLDTAAINKQCFGRVKTVEDKYEEERSKKKTLQEEKGNGEILVDPVDGKLHYRTESKKSKLAEADTDEAEKDVLDDENILNKSQRREKAKKSKREAKKHDKDLPNEILQEEKTPQAAVLEPGCHKKRKSKSAELDGGQESANKRKKHKTQKEKKKGENASNEEADIKKNSSEKATVENKTSSCSVVKQTQAYTHI